MATNNNTPLINHRPNHTPGEPLCGQQYPFTRNTVSRPCNSEELARGCTNGMQNTCQCPGTEALAINSEMVNTYSVPCPPGQCRCMSGPCGAGCCDDKYAIYFQYGGDRKIDPNRPNSFIESVDSFSVQMPSAKSRPEPDTKNRTCQCYSENKIDSTNLDAVSFNCSGQNGNVIIGLVSPACCYTLVPTHTIENEPCLEARVFSDDTPCPPGQCRCMSGPCGAGCCKNAYALPGKQD